MTRAERIEKNGGKPLMPPLDESEEYLLQYWQDLGLFESGGAAPAPLSARELEAWQGCTGIELTGWEFKTLRDMSRAYLSQVHLSEKPECPPPHGDPVNEFDRDVVSKKISNAFKALIQAKRK